MRASDIISFLALAWLLIALAFGLGYCAGQSAALGDCPAEDSCYADYYGGSWHVVPGQRP